MDGLNANDFNTLDYANEVNLASTLNGLNKTYTTPKRGIISVSVVSAEGGLTDFGINHRGLVERMYVNTNSAAGLVPIYMNFPVNAGEVLTVSEYNYVSYLLVCVFIPYKR